MYYDSKIIHKEWITHDVLKLKLEKPKTFQCKIGQAIELSIDILESFKHFAPFTLTNTNEDDFLEIIVKVYSEKKRLTFWLSELPLDSKIIISEAWDSYEYKGSGLFIAAGSGITPFIPMIRSLAKADMLESNILIYANKKQEDIILRDELTRLLGNKFLNVLSREMTDSYLYGKIDRPFLESQIGNKKKFYYICGSEGFNNSVKDSLISLGVSEDKIQVA